jgi:hypothetical protein
MVLEAERPESTWRGDLTGPKLAVQKCDLGTNKILFLTFQFVSPVPIELSFFLLIKKNK